MPKLTRAQKIITALTLGSAFLGLLGVAILVFWPFLQGPGYDRRVVANILNIEEAPRSLRILEIESPFTTDEITYCSVEIDPAEFASLLKGRDYSARSLRGTSHSVAGKVGPLFDVTTSFASWSPRTNTCPCTRTPPGVRP